MAHQKITFLLYISTILWDKLNGYVTLFIENKILKLLNYKILINNFKTKKTRKIKVDRLYLDLDFEHKYYLNPNNWKHSPGLSGEKEHS